MARSSSFGQLFRLLLTAAVVSVGSSTPSGKVVKLDTRSFDAHKNSSTLLFVLFTTGYEEHRSKLAARELRTLATWVAKQDQGSEAVETELEIVIGTTDDPALVRRLGILVTPMAKAFFRSGSLVYPGELRAPDMLDYVLRKASAPTKRLSSLRDVTSFARAARAKGRATVLGVFSEHPSRNLPALEALGLVSLRMEQARFCWTDAPEVLRHYAEHLADGPPAVLLLLGPGKGLRCQMGDNNAIFSSAE